VHVTADASVYGRIESDRLRASTKPNLYKTFMTSLMTNVSNLRQTHIFQIQRLRTNSLTL